jgi:8-amino-7-oxononanoate synthase
MSFWTRWAEGERDGLAAQGRRRQVRDFDARGPVGRLEPGGPPVVSFASNDYLGLSAHPAVVEGARAALDRWGAGAGSARLIVGSRPVHSRLETELARWKGTPRAVLFSTGFAANLGVLSAFGGPGVLICSDELNHASIVDGCRLSRARVAVYPHLDVGAVDRLLRDAPQGIVVTDTVFSMDGDTAPVDELAQVCSRHSALLVLDEAHAVLGPDPDLRGVDAIRIGTLSKFLGAMGGFAAASAPFAELLVNRARPFIFTTATSPADAGAALAAVRVLVSHEGAELKARLRKSVDRVRPGHPSPIVSIVLGSERAALDAAARLLERGLLVPAIRPPSVPPGSSRLRVTLSAAHKEEQVEALTEALNEIRKVPSDA